MRKGIFILVGALFLAVLAIVFTLPLFKPKIPFPKSKTETKKEKLDLESLKKFDQSHFGFMHPQASYPFV